MEPIEQLQELIGILRAISIVAKSLAAKRMQIEKKVEGYEAAKAAHDRKSKCERVVNGYAGFFFTDKNAYPEVALHWGHRFIHMVKRYNNIYRVQMQNITPYTCRHTYCSNMAKSGMNPETLQYMMGHSDISVTLDTYTHLGLEDATDKLKRMEELKNTRKKLEKNKKRSPFHSKCFG